MSTAQQSTADPGARRIILHADDFGMNRAVTDGIFRGFEEGLLTSASLMPNGPDAASALDRWKAWPGRVSVAELPSGPRRRRLGDRLGPPDLGIHLNLTEGRPLSSGFPSELLDPNGRFVDIVEFGRRLWRYGKRFDAALAEELDRQITFMLDHGVRPTHANGHQYVEVLAAVTRALPAVLERYRIGVIRMPVEPAILQTTIAAGMGLRRCVLSALHQACARRYRRAMRRAGMRWPAVFFGTVLAGRITTAWIEEFLRHESPTMEIGLHPAEPSSGTPASEAADGWHDPLASRRDDELRMLLSNELTDCLRQRQLCLGRLAEIPNA